MPVPSSASAAMEPSLVVRVVFPTTIWKGKRMNAVAERELRSDAIESNVSGVSWGAIFAGGAAAAALTLLLITLGAGFGFAVVSPWPDAGVSTINFNIGAGLYLVVVAMLASSVGGYLAGRLRTKWSGVHSDEVYFRDTAHGFLAWAVATLLGVGVLATTATHLATGASSGISHAVGTAAAQSAMTMDASLDKLLRVAPSADPRTADTARGELNRLLTIGFARGGDLPATDRAYVAQLVAARTGISAADAEKRVLDLIYDAKLAADNARKMARNFALWLAGSLLIGAFSASLAATEGGGLRDGTWHGLRRRAV